MRMPISLARRASVNTMTRLCLYTTSWLFILQSKTLMTLLSMASCLFLLSQIVANPAQDQRPKAAMEGTVTRIDSGQPVAGARVTVRRQSPGAGAQTSDVTTDDKGKDRKSTRLNSSH